MTIEHVAIVGGGFSGTLQAINLLRHDGPRATLIERHPRLARGVAYSAAHDRHLLNVRAGNMSAYPDAPEHFCAWLQRRGLGDTGSFVPRRVYGEYLEEQLEVAMAHAGDRLKIVREDVVDVLVRQAGVRVVMEGGSGIDADALVLALGNLPPHTPRGLDPERFGHGVYISDPWSGELGEGLTPDDIVLLLGTGLTMVDAAVLLDESGFRGRIVALSRRGLKPRVHAPVRPFPAMTERPPTRVSSLLSDVRAATRIFGWREAVDRLRPHAQNTWLAATHEERERFLRHLRPWWDVHRHRLAPEIGERLAGMQADGRLVIKAGKTLGFDPSATGADVRWRPRGEEEARVLRVRRIVNCTGPQGDLLASREPLLLHLIERGLARLDACRLGLDVDAQARLIGTDGCPGSRLFALGPMTRGAFWEITAVPDIRQQTWTLARRLSNAHWVGGEGL